MSGEMPTTTGSIATQLNNHDTSQRRKSPLLKEVDWVAAMSVARPVVTPDCMMPYRKGA